MTNDDAAMRLLNLPLPGDDAGAATGREWLAALLRAAWLDRHLIKRPFGFSGDWADGLYRPMTVAGLIEGSYDEDGYAHEVDLDAADELILAAIDAMGQAPGAAAGPARSWADELAGAGLRSITGDLNAGRPVTSAATAGEAAHAAWCKIRFSELNRRLLLRKAMEAWGREQYGEGHRDGMRDVRLTTHRASELEREAAEAAEKEKPDG
jgi:hypothetical protein